MTKLGSVSAIVDTNVLVYTTDQNLPGHAASLELLNRCARKEIDWRMTPQIVLEFLSIVVERKRVARPITSERAWAAMTKLRQACPLVAPPEDLVDRVEALVSIVRPRGPEIFDLAIAATALANGITTIYTYDQAVFSRVPGISVLTP